jgi:hypothetical protein
LTARQTIPRVLDANDLHGETPLSRTTGVWNRIRDEVRSVTERTGREARRAFDSGVLKVDLVSLRRERRRALADLGERLLQLWDRASLDGVERDPEMLRLRARVEGVEEAIAAKEAEWKRLRDASEKEPAAQDSPSATPES